MHKGTFSIFLLFLITLSGSMRIPQDEPFRNVSIVKVIAAHYNIGIQYNATLEQYQYDKKTFRVVSQQFINAYITQQTLVFGKHKRRLRQLKAKIQTMNMELSRKQQNQLASQLLAIFDDLHYSAYGFHSKHPDKYLGLLSNRGYFQFIKLGNEKKISKAIRRVTRMAPLEQLPQTYRYFYDRSYQITSQVDQDGVIQAIFDIIGTKNKFYVEVGGGNDYDNSRSLRNQHNWQGILFNAGVYLTTQDKGQTKDVLKMQMVSPEKAVQIFQKYKIPKYLDFLSIDIDGNDYWVTKALLEYFKPAVISVQLNTNIPIDTTAAIANCNPYFAWFQPFTKQYGVSIKAMYDLGQKYGYSYVYHMLNTDIFLVRNDLLPEQFKGMNIEDTFDVIPINRFCIGMQFQYQNLIERSQEDCSNETEYQIIQNNEQEFSQQFISIMVFFGILLALIFLQILINMNLTRIKRLCNKLLAKRTEDQFQLSAKTQNSVQITKESELQ